MGSWRGIAWIVLAACGRDIYVPPDFVPGDASDAMRDADVVPFDALKTYRIDTGTTLPYTPGAATGYFISYATGGHWRLDIASDATLPTFSGTASSVYWDVLSQPQEQRCSPTCAVVPLDSVTTQSLGFSATPTQSTEYFIITFDIVAGDAAELELYVNGAKQPSVVVFPNGGIQHPATLPSFFLPTTF